jgi:hypothetical protein
MHRFDYKGRNIVVKEDFDAERDKFGRIVGKSGGKEATFFIIIFTLPEVNMYTGSVLSRTCWTCLFKYFR